MDFFGFIKAGDRRWNKIGSPFFSSYKEWWEKHLSSKEVFCHKRLETTFK